MKNAFTFCARAVLAALALAGCSVGSTGGGYDGSVNSASYSVSDISYTGDAKAGDRLELSKIKITLTCVDASNSSQTYSYTPQEAYDHLKQKNASFSLSIWANGEQVISFGSGDEDFPETDNPFTFDAGTVEISISGAIGGNEVNSSSWIFVGEGTKLYCQGISDIAYAGGAKVDDALDLSNVEIALEMYFWDEQGEYQEATRTYNPQETYAFLKSQGISFSLAIAAGGDEVVSFGDADGKFPAHSPYTFKEAGEVEISIRGKIDMYEVSKSFSIQVEAKSRAENYEALLKTILGEDKYNEIKASLESNLGGNGLSRHLALTADLIKEVGGKWDAIMTSDEYDETVREYAAGFVAQCLGIITVTKIIDDPWSPEKFHYKITFGEKTSLKVGAEIFDLGEIEIANNGKIDFNDATFIGSNVTIQDINAARKSSLPTLSNITVSKNGTTAKDVYDLYKGYATKKEDLGKVNLSGNLAVVAFDGRSISGNKDYTLFNENDEAKESNDPSIISLNVDALSQMTEQLKIFRVSNMIVSGEANKERTVNWKLVNIVFEGNVSKITHNNTSHMYGIVYFKDMPYNNKNTFNEYRHFVYGMLKLKEITTDNFYVSMPNSMCDVLDIRGIDENFIKAYNKGIVKSGIINSIYFDEIYRSISDIDERFRPITGYINNIYYGEKREYGNNTDHGVHFPSSKTPRALKEFEYLGNTFINEGYYSMHFESSARSSYTDEEFEELDASTKQKLNDDHNGLHVLALNNKKIDFIDPETQKIIFSITKDRQYNA